MSMEKGGKEVSFIEVDCKPFLSNLSCHAFLRSNRFAHLGMELAQHFSISITVLFSIRYFFHASTHFCISQRFFAPYAHLVKDSSSLLI